jgi:hypothetical protein
MNTRMRPDEPLPPETIRRLKRKNRLWLLIVPPLLSLALVSIVKPAGRSAVMVELAIILLCSFLCGFALAVKSFKSARQRFWGGLVFSGGSLCLVSCVVFLGCMSIVGPVPAGRPMTPAQVEAMKQQQAAYGRQQEVQNKARVAKQLVPRDADADASMLDLTAFYNRLLPGQGVPTNAITQYQVPGIHTWQGIKFDVRGLIMANWDGWVETNQISVGQKCSELDFLHGTDWWMSSTNTICRFVVHFANGTSAAIPIVFGKDVSSSHFSNIPRKPNSALTNSVVWQERISTNAPPQPVYGFYIKKWSNPFPDEIVDSIDFEPSQSYSGAFLVAITIQPPAGEKP